MEGLKMNSTGDLIVNGLSAYDAIRMPDSPIKSLPKARSLLQARIDYRQAERTLIPFLIEREKIALNESEEKMLKNYFKDPHIYFLEARAMFI